MKIKRYTSYSYSGVQLLCCIHDILIKCIKLRLQHHSNVQKTNQKFVLSNSFSANVEACSGSYQSIFTRGQKVIQSTLGFKALDKAAALGLETVDGPPSVHK